IGFAAAFALAGAFILGCALFNYIRLPIVAADVPVRGARSSVMQVLREYFSQHKAGVIVMFILTYRLGEGLLVQKDFFFLDPRAAGGLGINAPDLALLQFFAGLPWVICGGIVGGYLIKWFGLKRVFVPFVLMINIPNLIYVWLAVAQPD